MTDSACKGHFYSSDPISEKSLCFPTKRPRPEVSMNVISGRDIGGILSGHRGNVAGFRPAISQLFLSLQRFDLQTSSKNICNVDSPTPLSLKGI